MKIIGKTCFMCTSELILVFYSMFPSENWVSVRFYKTCSFKRSISCNCDNSLHIHIIIGNTYSLWQNQVANRFLR